MTDTFDLSGGAPALDFVNTGSGGGDDQLPSYDRLVAFARASGLLTSDEALALQREASSHGSAARAVLLRAHELRQALLGLFAAVAAGREVAAGDLERLNRALGSALSHACLESKDGAFEWRWDRSDRNLDSVLWPIARSAGELLTSEEARRLSQCDGPTCSWLFLDRSRGRRRRWCDMKTCGNRAKAKRFYERHSGRGSSSAPDVV